MKFKLERIKQIQRTEEVEVDIVDLWEACDKDRNLLNEFENKGFSRNGDKNKWDVSFHNNPWENVFSIEINDAKFEIDNYASRAEAELINKFVCDYQELLKEQRRQDEERWAREKEEREKEREKMYKEMEEEEEDNE